MSIPISIIDMLYAAEMFTSILVLSKWTDRHGGIAPLFVLNVEEYYDITRMRCFL